MQRRCQYRGSFLTRESSRRRAFTLVELLVVIAILVVLASFVLPALARAKHQSRRAGCLSNQRQLAAVWFLYAGDHNDWLPANGMNDPPNPARKLWIQGVFFHASQATNAAFVADDRYALFAPYLRTSKVYVCPADRDVENSGQSHARVRSYAMNPYVGWTGAWDTRLSAAYRVFRRHSEIATTDPAGMFLFQDVHPESICWPYFGMHMTRDAFYNFPGSSHHNGGMLSFTDGHVEYRRWRDPRTVAARSPDYHKHNDSSPDNPDLAWMRERTSVRR